MKDHNQTHLGDAIKKWLDQHQMSDRMLEMRLRDELKTLLGPLEKRCEKCYLKKGVFHIKLDSAPLRHELSMAREKLKTDLNQAIGKEVITEILVF